ncbi:MAG: hypothetical protein ACTSXP_08765 [Promethearchaeota archaeon]
MIFGFKWNGNVYFIPFSYMQGKKVRKDPLCCFKPEPDWPHDGEFLIPVSAGGFVNLENDSINRELVHVEQDFPRGNILFFKLVVIKDGMVLDARIIEASAKISGDVEIKLDISTDAKFLNAYPDEFYIAGAQYDLKIQVKYVIPRKYGLPFIHLDRHWHSGKKLAGELVKTIRFKFKDASETRARDTGIS